ncbi:enoyl-CoA hydratase/isomerase family protein [Actinocrispum wychmicini]|uniref:Enoyl-CoA hydratase/carnithine racemase n=1 Tax=Actinocrispum wychmicini TaxID=1213861 RepID=A0A4R2JKN6_9PSEU|nr:enoyl-CoA hydratase/isomerase family protein [Actinocrispum wychmicini]TCO54735.1 enoyl-CoA hydratase/carnithine racemase [Actinocrispum wychmicini]
MSDLEITADGPVLTVTFNRPKQRNAMTWGMYEGLAQACSQADADDTIRVMVLRGAGGQAFVAGTDITQFAKFSSGEDGVDYEHRVTDIIDRLSDVDVPTVAVIDGYCVGGGLGIACACDLRIATPRSVFGVPIARTLGNCLSTATLALLTHHFGQSRTTELLLTARMMAADEARATGFLSEVAENLDDVLALLVERLLGHAPLSMWATKEALRRLRRAGVVDDTDIISRVYGSADFHAAVTAFTAKKRPEWTGH